MLTGFWSDGGVLLGFVKFPDRRLLPVGITIGAFPISSPENNCSCRLGKGSAPSTNDCFSNTCAGEVEARIRERLAKFRPSAIRVEQLSEHRCHAASIF
jgi:hypothetical protein